MRIINMELTNFQGIKHFSFSPDGHNCNIYGDNGTGKTTICNAYHWLLYGRPGTEEKSYTPQTAGTHGGEHVAEMTVQHEHQRITLKKVFREKEVKKRGGGTEYKRTVEHYIDSVPVKEKDYMAAVSALVPQEMAQTLTRPGFFLETTPLKERREVLVKMADNISDENVVSSNEKLSDVIRLLAKDGGGRYTVEECRKICKNTKREAQAELAAIKARMEEAKLSRPSMAYVNEGGTRANLEEYRKDLAELQKQLWAAEGTAEADVRREIAELKAERARLEAEYIHECNAYAAEMDEKGRKLDRRSDELEREETALLNQARALTEDAKTMEESRAVLLDEYNALQRLYQETSETVFDGETCPICGQPLPPGALEEKRKEFNISKSSELEAIRRKINETVAAGKHVPVEAIAAKKDEARKLKADAAKKHEESERLHIEAITLHVNADPEKRTPFHETEDGRIIIAAISHAEGRLVEAAASAASAAEGLEEKIKKKQEDIASSESILARVELAKQCDLRISELQAKQKEASIIDEEAERSIWLLNQFEQTKALLLDEQINQMFASVKFRLSKVQANGEVVEDCEAMLPCDGQEELVPYRSANNARRINAGLEVIDRLSQFYGISAPIFVDNAESCTAIAQTQGQQIRLYVSKGDKNLRVEGEGCMIETIGWRIEDEE